MLGSPRFSGLFVALVVRWAHGWDMEELGGCPSCVCAAVLSRLNVEGSRVEGQMPSMRTQACLRGPLAGPTPVQSERTQVGIPWDLVLTEEEGGRPVWVSGSRWRRAVH